jgi:hypothetical protein
MIVFSFGILLLSLTATSAGRIAPRAHQLDETYTFSQYLAHFSKSYPDPKEYARRSAIFYSNLEKILKHNEGRINEFGKVVKGYVMGVNRFTDLEVHELPMGYNKAHRAWINREGGVWKATARRLGGKQVYSVSLLAVLLLLVSIILMVLFCIFIVLYSPRYLEEPPEFEMEEVSDLPDSVNWSDKINPAPNQGDCGACWAFAATACIESQLAIATGEDPVKLSETNMLECAPNPQHCGGEKLERRSN